MGNHVSGKFKTSTGSPKLILPTGETQLLRQPTAAAELMLETPNFFIVNSKSLKLGARFCPLNADDNLEKANVYVMFPIQRKGSVVTATDLASLFVVAKSAAKRGKGRVSPEITIGVVPKLDLEGIEDVSTPEFRHRLSMSRSRKPMLETIDEEAICSR